MAERNKSNGSEDKVGVNRPVDTKTDLRSFQFYRNALVIDKDDLNECLSQQPELYFHVSDAHALAIAERDEAKLDFEVAEAEEAQKIRDKYAEKEEKLTEGGLKEQLRLSKKLDGLRAAQVERKALVEKWAALKESYSQRSYMLRQLVPMYISRFASSGMRVGGLDAMADAVHERAGSVRETRGYKR
jgi:hypothetical protein